MDENVTLESRIAGRDGLLDGLDRIEKALAGKKTFRDPGPLPVNQRLKVINKPKETEFEGENCYHLPAGKNPSYLVFAVPSEYAFFADRDFDLEIEYFDSGRAGDVIRIEYDSALGGPMPQRGDPYRAIEFAKDGRKGWQTATVRLPQARFMNRQIHGGDLRLSAGADQEEYIAAVRLLEVDDQ